MMAFALSLSGLDWSKLRAMLWMLLALTSPLEAATPVTIASIADLDKACSAATDTPDTPKHVTLSFSGKQLSLAAEDEHRMTVRDAFPALDGQVMVHWIDRTDLQWEGNVGRQAALDAYEKGDAVAVMQGQLGDDKDYGFPSCFGHPQIDARTVAMRIDEVIISDTQGARLGRLSPKQDLPPLPSGGVARVSAVCGKPCMYSDRDLQAFVEKVESNVLKCTRNSTVGTVVFGLVVRPSSRGIPSIRSEVSSLNDRVRACVRTAISLGRFEHRPRTTSEITVIVDIPDLQTTEI